MFGRTPANGRSRVRRALTEPRTGVTCSGTWTGCIPGTISHLLWKIALRTLIEHVIPDLFIL